MRCIRSIKPWPKSSMTKGPITSCRSKATKAASSKPPKLSCRRAFPPQVVRVEDNRSRRERRALATRAIEPLQLGLAGAAQLGCLHRQSGQQAQEEVEHLVTSRVVSQLDAEAFL